MADETGVIELGRFKVTHYRNLHPPMEMRTEVCDLESGEEIDLNTLAIPEGLVRLVAILEHGNSGLNEEKSNG